jgi:hypothetical protein
LLARGGDLAACRLDQGLLHLGVGHVDGVDAAFGVAAERAAHLLQRAVLVDAVLEHELRLGAAREAIHADVEHVGELFAQLVLAVVGRGVVVAELVQRFRHVGHHLGVGLHLLDVRRDDAVEHAVDEARHEVDEVHLLQELAGDRRALARRARREGILADIVDGLLVRLPLLITAGHGARRRDRGGAGLALADQRVGDQRGVVQDLLLLVLRQGMERWRVAKQVHDLGAYFGRWRRQGAGRAGGKASGGGHGCLP